MKSLASIVVLVTLATSAWATDQCHIVRNDVRTIEEHLNNARLNECAQVTPQLLALQSPTEDQTALVQRLRCSSLPEVEERLAQIETQQLVEDGLRELTAQVVSQQATLADAPDWQRQEHELAAQFAQDVSLGAMIQTLHDSSLTAALLATPAEGSWQSRAGTLCAQPAHANTTFCLLLANTSVSTGMEQEFGQLLAGLPATGLTEEMRRQLDITGQDISNFEDLHVRLRGSSLGEPAFDGLLQQEGTRFTPAQATLVRSLQLRPGAPEGPLARLTQRLAQRGSQIKVSTQLALTRQNMQDASARHKARAQARWSVLWGTLAAGQSVPCLPIENEASITCLRNAVARTSDSNNRQTNGLLDSIISGFGLAKSLDERAVACTNEQALAALRAGAPLSNCQSTVLSEEERANSDEERRILLAMRQRFQAQEATWLRFRDQVFDEARACSDFESIVTAGSSSCDQLGSSIQSSPIDVLVSGTLEVIDDGLRATGRRFIRDEDCNADTHAALQPVCSRLNGVNRPRDPVREPVAVRTPDRQTTTPNGAGRAVVRNAFEDAFQDIFNAYNQSQAPVTNPWWNQTAPNMPYSQPMNMGFSDYIMGYGMFQGYAPFFTTQSYQAMSNSFLPAGFAATDLSSRFFGGTTPSLAGSFRF